jgi:hypothetical protein
LKPASTPSSRSAKFSVISCQFTVRAAEQTGVPRRCPAPRASCLCSGRLLRRALFASLWAATLATAQSPTSQTPKKIAAHRANEMTLASLRPGKDTAARAIQLLKVPQSESSHDAVMVWGPACQNQTLSVELDSNKTIQVIRAIETPWSLGDCASRSPGPWKTGLGLRVGDPAAKVTQLYGNPDSKSPSTRDSQPLELWYYAFDWAGPDVPQVMEILCTREKEGQPGRVVEITLAAPSL